MNPKILQISILTSTMVQLVFFGVKNFPSCAHKTIEAAKSENIKGRALDLGCAVGRATIELAQYFDEVVGIDYSNSFIEAANKVLHEKHQ